MKSNNLPVKVENKSIIDKIKNSGIKTLKVLGTGAMSLGFLGAVGLSTLYNPLFLIPSIVGAGFSIQKFFNNTVYKSYKDLVFIARNNHGNIKIVQDLTRFDLTRKIKKLSNIDKLAYMQLQLLVGLTKMNDLKLNNNEPVIETLSHGVNQKTFKKLEELGYIKDYVEEFKKNSAVTMGLSKIAFGNFRELTKKEKFYNIKFKLTDKKIDFEDKNLRKNFPMVFSERRGIIAKLGLDFKFDKNGAIVIDYNSQNEYIKLRKDNKIKQERKKFIKQIRNISTLEVNQRREADYLDNIEKNHPNISKEDDRTI